MWTNMYIRAKKKDVPWLEEMFDDSLVHSTSDSYGGITQLKEGDDKNTIIKRADRAMYLAKDKGSNKTKVLI